MGDCVDDDDGDWQPCPDPGPGPDSLAGARQQLLNELARHEAIVRAHPGPVSVALEVDGEVRVDPAGLLRRLASRVDSLERAMMTQHTLVLHLALNLNSLCMRVCGRESP